MSAVTACHTPGAATPFAVCRWLWCSGHTPTTSPGRSLPQSVWAALDDWGLTPRPVRGSGAYRSLAGSPAVGLQAPPPAASGWCARKYPDVSARRLTGPRGRPGAFSLPAPRRGLPRALAHGCVHRGCRLAAEAYSTGRERTPQRRSDRSAVPCPGQETCGGMRLRSGSPHRETIRRLGDNIP
jgi:hypothetical protein